MNSHYEPLEPRLVLSHAEPDLISVGRVLSAWSASDVVDGQLKVTYSVYNQQADEVSGVLLTTTLEPGVMFVGASVLPDRSGQELAWSLGTLDPFGRASVEVTVALASPMQLAIDDGAEAFGTLYARAVSDEAHAAVLRSEPIDADLLRSTPDANTTDPFILAKAAELNQDATEIFHYLTHEVGYGSYVGSLRGARGTLWSSAGNALDEASLGIALLRSSGVPARYVQGTLPDNFAQELILSMFPESFQVVGYIPPGADVADPAHDPRLLAETREHYWIQFDAGAGMQDIDTTFAHAEPGQTFAEASGTFGEVPDALRHKVTVRLKAEVINQLSSLFFAGPPEASTVLEQAFNAAELVGRPITVGHFVSSSTLPSPIFVSTTINYSPYLTIGDVAFPPADDEVVRGTDFQEVRTNFPLGSQTVTGVFLEIETFGDGATSVYQKTIADRIGLAARRGGAASVSIDPEGPPLISPLDMMTISVSPSLFDRRGLLVYTTQLAALETEFDALQAQLLDTGIPDGPQGEELAQRATDFFRALVATSSRAQLASFQVASDLQTEAISSGLGIRAYHDSPRLLIVDTKASLSDEGILELRQSLDLLKDDVRAVLGPGQGPIALVTFHMQRGFVESAIATSVFANTPPSDFVAATPTAQTILTLARDQGIPTVTLAPDGLSALEALQLPAGAKTLIGDALERGKLVLAPAVPVLVGEELVTGWFEIDTVTGETKGVVDDVSKGTIPSGPNGRLFVEDVAGYLSRWLPVEIVQAGLGILAATIEIEIAKVIKNFLIKEIINNAASTFFGVPRKTSELLQGLVNALLANLAYVKTLEFKLPAFVIAFELTLLKGIYDILHDPPLLPFRFDPSGPSPSPPSIAQFERQVVSSGPAGVVHGEVSLPNFRAAGQLQVSWDTLAASNSFLASSLTADEAVVMTPDGRIVGTGQVGLSQGRLIPVSVEGPVHVDLAGRGSISFYAPSTSGLGVAGEWSEYSALLTGDTAMELNTDALLLDGVRLPDGTYTIVATNANLRGSGLSSSPSFAGTASVEMTDTTISLGPGAGELTVADRLVPTDDAVTIAQFEGLATVTHGSDRDSIRLTGAGAEFVRMAATTATPTLDGNGSAVVGVALETSLTDAFTVVAEGPPNWSVAFDSLGRAVVAPPSGVPEGSYVIRVTARSVMNPQLAVQDVVTIDVTRSLPGMALEVEPDALITVPFRGVQVPTAFQAAIRNLGPETETYRLSFPDPPAGFKVLRSADQLRVPAGETGIIGVYLEPEGEVPPPGMSISFTVLAASTINPELSEARTIEFEMPEVRGVVLDIDAAPVTAIPGFPTEATLFVRAVGNVSQIVNLSAILPPGLALDGLDDLTLGLGDVAELALTLTPDAGTPLGSMLTPTIVAEFGAAEPVTLMIPMVVAAPGAAAVADAAVAAGQLGNPDLANRLNDLSIALTNIVQDPTSSIYRSQAVMSLDAITQIAGADSILNIFVDPVTRERDALAAATTPEEIQRAVLSLGSVLDDFGGTVTNLSRHNFEVFLFGNSQVALPQTPARFQARVHNIGAATTTYNIGVSGLPEGVTAEISDPSVTLDRGGMADVFVILTPASEEELLTYDFSIEVSVAGISPPISRSVAASVIAREEFLSVPSVESTPPFTEPGGQVDVSARVLNVVNRRQEALVSYVVNNSSGQTLFTSTPVPVQFDLAASLLTVDLGTFDTTSLDRGDYSIVVMVTDADGEPILGGVGRGSLLVGSPVSATLTVNIPPGLQAEFFDFTTGTGVLPDLTGRTPDVTRIDSQLNYASTGSPWTGLDERFVDTFASRHTGVVNIETAGDYTFYLSSDDGSKLWLDEELIINNDGLHGMVELSATRTLTAGFHSLRIEFFESGGNAGLILSWSGPGISKQVIPADVLSIGPTSPGAVILPPGTGTVSNRLEIEATAQLNEPSIVGQAPVAGATDAIREGDLVYVAGSGGISIFDVTDESEPTLIRTFGTPAKVIRIHEGRLYAVREPSGANQPASLTVYSLTDPQNPTPTGNTPPIPYNFVHDLVVTDTHAYIVQLQLCFFLASGDIFEQNGDILAINITDPAAPFLEKVLFNTNGTNNDGIASVGGCDASGGDSFVWSAAQANDNTLLITSSTSSGTDTQSGVGRLQVVDIDPASLTWMSVVGEVPIPGTNQLIGIAIYGDRALVTANSGNFRDPGTNFFFTGDAIVGTLDVSNPRSPQLLHTEVFAGPTRLPGRPAAIGDGLFTFASHTGTGAEPLLHLVDARDPRDLKLAGLDIPSSSFERLSADSQFIYTASASGLIIYQVPMQFTNPLSFQGLVDTPAIGTSVAVHGSIVYVAGTEDISIVDVHDPTSPLVVGSFASENIVSGGVNIVEVVGDRLYVAATTTLNAAVFTLLIFDIADPLNPSLVSSTNINYVFMSDLAVLGESLFVPTNGFFFFGGGDIFDQFGDFVSVDVTNETVPVVADVLFNTRGPNQGSGTSQHNVQIVGDQFAYVVGSTSTGGDTQVGSGRVLVVDISDPRNLTLHKELAIPNTVHAFNIAIEGNRALVMGSTGGWADNFGPLDNSVLSGNVTLTMLDTSDPANPAILGPTLVLQDTEFPRVGLGGRRIETISLGNGLFTISGIVKDGQPALLIVDPTDPANLIVSSSPVPELVNGMAVSGSTLYTTSSTGLAVYEIGELGNIPVTAAVQVPKGTGVEIVPGSFNVAPTKIIPGPEFDTLIWNRSLAFGNRSFTFTWLSTVEELQPGEAREVTLDSRVSFSLADQPPRFVDPYPYLIASNSFFDLSGLGTTFFLEDFEDHQLNTPGVTASAGVPASTFAGGTLNDSVDADDGVIDGSGLAGDNYFFADGATGITFTFEANVLGGLPTEVGIVWTDGGGTITFEAFDAAGNSLGTRSGDHADGTFLSTTAEDRFYGIIYPSGISAITISNSSGGIEVDHLQYGRGADPAQLVKLAPTSVVAEQVLGLDPPTRTVRPGQTAGYTITIANPAQTSVIYDLTVLGVPAEWVSIEPTVTIPAGGSVELDLTLTSGPFTPPSDHGFVVVAATGGVSSSVEGTLTLAGEPILPDVDPESHGVVLALSPAQATAGQGTPATFTARVTNTGSATDTFVLSTDNLPPDLAIVFEQDTLTIPPGANNFREVRLTVTPSVGAAAVPHSFRIVATSMAHEDATDAAEALVSVVASGVAVRLLPESGSPGGTFELMVTNTGTVTDTFALAISAPAALAALLASTSVTLDPGQSQMVPIEVGEIDFAFPGLLSLVGSATSTTQPNVRDADTADVMIEGELGVAAELIPDELELAAPGMTTLLLVVENIGNLEDAYSATITSTTGPLTARLTDLDGTLVETVPLFRLPGLSTGAILVQADLSAFGTGTITVLIRSLTDESVTAEATATIRAVSESQTSSIRGVSYVDANNNGQVDAREQPLLGTPIVLLDASGSTVAATFTNLQGEFRFDGLAAGTYTVQKMQPPLFFDGLDTAGSLGDEDAEANKFTLTLPAATEATGYLFAERGLLPQYIGKSPYLSSTPADLWDNLNLVLSDLWHTFEAEGEQFQAAVSFADEPGSVSLELFDESMRPLSPRPLGESPRTSWNVTPGERYYLRLSGTDQDVDLSLAFEYEYEPDELARSGDLSGDGAVDQADLDLVLLAWGQDESELGRMSPRPGGGGLVGQEALDAVLLNWGR